MPTNTQDTAHPLIASIKADYATIVASDPRGAYSLLLDLEDALRDAGESFVQLVAARERDEDGTAFGDPYLVMPGTGTDPVDAVEVLEIDVSRRQNSGEVTDEEYIFFHDGDSQHETLLHAVDQGGEIVPVRLPAGWETSNG